MTESVSSPQANTPRLWPTVLVHAVILAVVSGALFVGAGFTTRFLTHLSEEGQLVQLPSLTQIVITAAGGWRLLVICPLMLAVDVGVGWLAREIGGRTGMRWWSVTAIVGLMLLVAVSCAGLWLPMSRFHRS